MSSAAVQSIQTGQTGQTGQMPREPFVLRAPRSTDGALIHDLVARCKPLDENSMYCNLIQATHFRETSVAAEAPDGSLLGFISGYLVPDSPDTLFIWQVAVSKDARGMGLGKKMLKDILARNEDVHYMHTTVTPDNKASWGMFRSLARDLDAPVNTTVMFDSEAHFDGKHDDEVLIQIGPFDVARALDS